MSGKTVDRGIRELEAGVYTITVSTGRDPVTGRYGRAFSTVHGGIRAARAERDRLSNEVTEGKHRKTTVTVNRLLDDWLEHLITVGRAPKTIRNYRNWAKVHVRPGLGDVALKKLSSHDLDRLYRHILSEDKQSTAAHVHRMMRAALNQALRWRWVNENVAELATAPAEPYKKIVAPEPEEIIILIEAAERSRRPEMAKFFFVASTCGVRRSELCGVRPDIDIDRTRRTMTIERTLTDLDSRGEPARQLRERQPKTRRGQRSLAVDEVTLAVIDAQIAFMAERARAGGTQLAHGHYLFSDSWDGSVPWKPDSVTRYFTRLRDRIDLGHLTLHTLRKFMETRMLDAGYAVPTVAARAGQDPTVMLRHYAGAVTETDHRAAAAVAALISPRALEPVS